MPTDAIAERNKQLTRKWFQEIWNNRNFDAVNDLAHAEARAWGFTQTPGEEISLSNFRPFWQKFIEALPDIHVMVDDVIAEGDKTCVRFTANGTHSGPGLGIAPTGRRINITCLCLIQWQDGRIAQAWNEFDAYGLIQQLSAPPAAPHAAPAPGSMHAMQVKL